MSNQSQHVLTHHVNIANPSRGGDVVTFEPGAELPKWASDVLLAEAHPAFPPRSSESERLVRAWLASKTVAEVMAEVGEV